MAMNASTLKTALKATMKTKISAKFGDPTDATALDNFCDAVAEALATEVVNHVKTYGVVTVASGIAVSTTGTAAAQTGATTATGTGTIA